MENVTLTLNLNLLFYAIILHIFLATIPERACQNIGPVISHASTVALAIAGLSIHSDFCLDWNISTIIKWIFYETL